MLTFKYNSSFIIVFSLPFHFQIKIYLLAVSNFLEVDEILLYSQQKLKGIKKLSAVFIDV